MDASLEQELIRVTTTLPPPHNRCKQRKDLHSHYAFFPPHEYVGERFVTSELIDSIANGGTVLSLGAGAGQLEYALQQLTGAKAEQFLLADLRRHPDTPEQFASVAFDFRTTWPELGQFTHVLFPQSLFVAHLFPISGSYIDGDRKRSNRIAQKIIREKCVSSNDAEWFLQEAERLPRYRGIRDTLQQAYAAAAPGGDIRSSWFMAEHMRAAMMLTYERNERGARIRPWNGTEHDSMIIQKPNTITS